MVYQSLNTFRIFEQLVTNTMLNYQELELKYGADLRRKVRHLENLSKKHGRSDSKISRDSRKMGK